MLGEAMPDMSRANAALYLASAQCVMPVPPDFSKSSYDCDRGRLVELVPLAEAGLRAYGNTGAQALDRHRHRCAIALEARARTAQAA
jgi:hypothetical protein